MKMLSSKAYMDRIVQDFKDYANTNRFTFNVVQSPTSPYEGRWNVTGNNNEKVTASTSNDASWSAANEAAKKVRDNTGNGRIVDNAN